MVLCIKRLSNMFGIWKRKKTNKKQNINNEVSIIEEAPPTLQADDEVTVGIVSEDKDISNNLSNVTCELNELTTDRMVAGATVQESQDYIDVDDCFDELPLQNPLNSANSVTSLALSEKNDNSLIETVTSSNESQFHTAENGDSGSDLDEKTDENEEMQKDSALTPKRMIWVEESYLDQVQARLKKEEAQKMELVNRASLFQRQNHHLKKQIEEHEQLWKTIGSLLPELYKIEQCLADWSVLNNGCCKQKSAIIKGYLETIASSLEGAMEDMLNQPLCSPPEVSKEAE